MISWCGWNAGCTIFTMDESRLAMLCETRNAASALEQGVPIRVKSAIQVIRCAPY